VEEDASFASLAARQATGAAGNWRILLACELVAAVRALRARGIVPGSEPPVRPVPRVRTGTEVLERLIDQFREL
jgi:histidine ammonia-lyase